MQINTENKYLIVYLIEKGKLINVAYIPVNKYVTGSTIEALAESTDAPASDLSYLIIKNDAYNEAFEKNDISIVKDVFRSYRIKESKESIIPIYGAKPNPSIYEKRGKNTDISYSAIFKLLDEQGNKGVIGAYLQNDSKITLIPNKTSF